MQLAPAFATPAPCGSGPAPQGVSAGIARRIARALEGWRERRRIARDHRRDMAELAWLDDRQLDDIGAPGWIRAELRFHRL